MLRAWWLVPSLVLGALVVIAGIEVATGVRIDPPGFWSRLGVAGSIIGL